MGQRIIVIGGGLAGLAAAVALAERGFRVTLLESRSRLGGRASSFNDQASGQLVDTCQHVSMGCCTNLAHFCKTLGIDRFLEPQPVLYFMTPDRRVSRFGAWKLPAPLHLAPSFLRMHTLGPLEKLRVAYGLLALKRADVKDDPPFQSWLDAHYQTPRIVQRFWGLVLVSALNETPERIGLRYAKKVFVDGFLTHRRGFEVELPSVPLGRLYGEELLRWLAAHHVDVRLGEGVKSLLIENGRVAGVTLRKGDEVVRADAVVSSVPFARLLDLLPEATVAAHDYFGNLRQMETSPITSVHLWYDRPVMDLPHVVLVDCLGQWVFQRGGAEHGEHYVQVVVSAARQFRGLGNGEVERRVADELRSLLPRAQEAKVLRSRVVTEHAATFSAVPGVDRLRPVQTSPLANLYVAGDWTATGWPATMEGAVRSGYLAAERILDGAGRGEKLVQPNLGEPGT